MWRIEGVQYYRAILLVTILLAVAALISLLALMSIRELSLSFDTVIFGYLQAAITNTFIILLILTIYNQLYYFISSRRMQRYNAKYTQWLEHWSQALFAQSALPQQPQSIASLRALTDLMRSLDISYRRRLQALAHDYGVHHFWVKRLDSVPLNLRLEALASLGILGEPQALPAMLAQTESPQLEIRIAAVQALATMIAILPANWQRETIWRLGDALRIMDFPAPIIEEVYALLGNYAADMLNYLLKREDLPISLLLATIYAIGHTLQIALADRLVAFLVHPNARVRALCLHTFAQLKYLPDAAYAYVLQAATDADSRVRQNAMLALKTMALPNARLALWLALGDEKWRVRFNAGQALLQYGEKGRQLLLAACQTHPQAAARTIAEQILTIPQKDADIWLWDSPSGTFSI